MSDWIYTIRLWWHCLTTGHRRVDIYNGDGTRIWYGCYECPKVDRP